jgi:hypothetical protein
MTDAIRQKRYRDRVKIGMRRVQIFVPEEMARQFVLKRGWLLKSRARNFSDVEYALGRVLNSLIEKYVVTCNDNNLHSADSVEHTPPQVEEKSNA